MPSVSMRQLLEAGVHFGHQTRRWNPKMKPFIFAERNGIHIIDLAQTVQRLDVALEFVRETVARGDQVLFVGTKKQAQEPVLQEATRANQPYVNKRWLGGMLTNFTTIKKRIALLEQLEARQQNGDFERMTKKEAAKLTEEMVKLQGTLGGMRKMKRLPGAIFIVDPHRERIGGDRGEQARDPGRRHRRHERRSRRARLHHPGQRRRHPGHPAPLHARRRCRDRGRPRALAPAAPSPKSMEPMVASEPEEEIPGATDELVAALAGGAALSFDPGIDDDEDLLPGDRSRVPRRPWPKRPRHPLRRSRPSSHARRPRRARRLGRRLHAHHLPPGGRATARAADQHDENAAIHHGAARTGARNRHGGHLCRAGQGAPRADRRRLHGLQERPRQTPTGTSRRRPACCASAGSPRPPRRPTATPARAWSAATSTRAAASASSSR